MALTEKYVSSLAAGGGTGNSEASPYTFTEAITEIKSATGTGGQNKRYNVKADGIYNRSSYDDIGGSGGGTNAAPVVIRGYKTVIGDGYLGRFDDNGPLIVTNMPYFIYGTGQGFNIGRHMVIESIRFQGQQSGPLLNLESRCWLIGCIVLNADNNFGTVGVTVREGGGTLECDFSLSATSGLGNYVLRLEGQGCKIDSCRIITNCSTSGGINVVDRWGTIYGNLIRGAGGGYGIYSDGDTNRHAYVRNNTITGWADAVRVTGALDSLLYLGGNIVTDNSGYAFNMMSVNGEVIIGPNRTRDNVLGDVNGVSQWAFAGRMFPTVTTDTGGPETDFVNAAAGDYRLIAGSPARNTNVPKWSDLGAYDYKESGGAAAVFHPLLPQIIRPAPSD